MTEGAERCIRVSVALPVDRSFIYQVPGSLGGPPRPGTRVLVPFGRRRVTGYVLGPAIPSSGYAVKSVLDILDAEPLFPESMIPFFDWIARYYLCPLGMVIESALPGGLNLSDHAVLTLTDGGEAARSDPGLTPMEGRLLGLLAEGARSLRFLDGRFKDALPAALIRRCEERGWVSRQRRLSGGTTHCMKKRYAVFGRYPEDGGRSLSAARRRALDLLSENGEMAVAVLKSQIASAPGLLSGMEKSGLLTLVERDVYRDPLGDPVARDHPHEANPQQAAVIASVCQALGQGYAAFLLAGVTGSGKTEVYLQLARRVLDRGLGVLVLVPEIALISQMERRFRARFGDEIAVLHSRLSAGERYDQWERIRTGALRVVVGVRSAVFAPLGRIGLIIVDEEHDPSYKSGNDLRYHARDVAVARARFSDTVVLLASATPAVQTWHNVESGKYRPLRLTRRVEERPMPEITVVDLRKIRARDNPAWFLTPQLTQAMTETLARGEQALLFLNRRGFAGLALCGQCGQAVRCRSCEVSLTFHQGENQFKCHYCGYCQKAVSVCPSCGRGVVRLIGLGTEKLESTVRARFPSARILRLDRDTTARKDDLFRLLRQLRRGEVNVLVGTQMVSKGHDFPNVTLVGIVCADLTLNFPDFRSGERTFQVLAQVAGRAGRGDRPGQVILQTYTPDHFSIQSARKQDFEGFYAQEIAMRRAAGYPPCSRLLQFLVWGKDADRVEGAARALGAACHQLLRTDPDYAAHVTILGPAAAPIPRMADRYHWHVLLKSTHARTLHRFFHGLKNQTPGGLVPSGVRLAVDVDPYDLM